MKRLLITSAFALTLGLSLVGGASAADHTHLGTPGSANCLGETVAAFAQDFKNGGSDPGPGLGNYYLVKENGASMQEIQNSLNDYCTLVP